jgi:hypothetical protein
MWLTGSPHLKMDDACNANPLQQIDLLVSPNSPLPAACDPNYPYQLNNSQSDWDELDAVVEFIRNKVHGPGSVQKVALIGWSAAAFQIGPYAFPRYKFGSIHLDIPNLAPARAVEAFSLRRRRRAQGRGTAAPARSWTSARAMDASSGWAQHPDLAEPHAAPLDPGSGAGRPG